MRLGLLGGLEGGWVGRKVGGWLVRKGVCVFVKNTYELVNLRPLKFSTWCKNHILQGMGKMYCVEFERYPLKFHTKYLTHTLKDV